MHAESKLVILNTSNWWQADTTTQKIFLCKNSTCHALVLSGAHTAHDIVRCRTMSYDIVRIVNTALVHSTDCHI